MPLLESAYNLPRWLRHGHLATVLPAFWRTPVVAWTRRERLELEDGDFLDLVWWEAGHSRLAVLSHGLEGSVEAGYIRRMAAALAASGWNVLAWNYRSCGGIPNRLLQSYHSGASPDLRTIVNHAAPFCQEMALVGFSLGGNISLKYAGEMPPPPPVTRVVAISAPVDLASSARVLDERPGNRYYLNRFLRTLIRKATAKAIQFPGEINAAALRGIRTIREFDERITAPIHGFAGAEDYWTRASSLPLIGQIPIPSLLINAADDPLLDQPSLPRSLAKTHTRFHLEIPSGGGHVGFPGPAGSQSPWLAGRVIQFLENGSS